MSEVVKPVSSFVSKTLGLKNALKTPTPPEAPKSIATDTKAVQEATAEASQRRSKARGFQSTILSRTPQQGELKQTYGS